MPAPTFVHLRLHSEFSVSEGTVRLDEAVGRAAADGMAALALTDLSNLFGMVKFYRAAREAGVKPVLGADCWISNEADRDKPHRLLLLVRSRAGYLRLCELLSRAWLENQHRGRAEIRADWLAESAEGLIALSGGPLGDVGQALAAGNEAAARRAAERWASIFPDAFYLELQRTGEPVADACVEGSLAIAGELDLPVVATHPVQFLRADEFKAHEARVCIAEGYTLSDKRRPRLHSPQSWFRTQADMQTLFADLPEALANSVEIARRCNLELELGKHRLPLFPTPEGISLDDFLVSEAERGLERRLEHLYPEAEARAQARPRYAERLAFETKTIIQMGFPGYFLIVADFINWAKNNGVPVGPGRGSGAGSLVAYALGITDLDPLRYDLLFERFLNPERVSMPDFDIDFCQDGRDRVIDYVKRKYGAASVAQIATFGTMAAKAVVRDVGRVMDWGYNRTDELAKLIPFQPGKLITLEMAREMEPRFAEREAQDEETRELLALAGQLEGLTRNVGMHAGGVLIAPGKLTDFCPLYSAQGAEGVVSQFDKDDVEAVGLVKFDFLGLTTLTILDWTLRFIRRLDPASAIALEALPLDDPTAYRVFADGNTTAVFQFESRGMRDLLKRARPDRFEDIIALVALYRPGPMDLIPDFIDRKHGREEVIHLDPRLEPILGSTYGVMVYQEQVMQIAQVIGGYSLGGADLLRRAMGKKKPEEMAKHRDIFVEGALKNDVEQRRASELFDMMEKFAGYGFNKSHAAAYALVAYHTAWFKAHHPAAFMAANLSAVMDDTDKVQILCADARQIGLRILPPDVNASEYRFVPVDEKTLRYGLGGVKGTGEAAIESIIAARADGPFVDLFDFCRRTDKRIVNRRSIEAMVRAGAFDSITDHRAGLLASIERAFAAAEQAERDAQQSSLFGDAESGGDMALELVPTPRWDERVRLQEEKAALGFYLSGHPFDVYAPELRRVARTSLAGVLAQVGAAAPRGGSEGEGGRGGSRGGEPTVLAGVVVSTQMRNTSRGRMAVVLLDDGTAQVEVTLFSEMYDEYRDLIRDDRPLIVQGKVRRDEYSGSGVRVNAERLFDLGTFRARFGKTLRLSMNGEANARRLHDLLSPFRKGGLPVAIDYHRDGAACCARLGPDWQVMPDEQLIDDLRAWLRPENVQVEYA